MKKSLIEKSQNSRNATHFLKLANMEANKKYFTELQPAPLLEIKEVRVEFPQWVENWVLNTLGSLRP